MPTPTTQFRHVNLLLLLIVLLLYHGLFCFAAGLVGSSHLEIFFPNKKNEIFKKRRRKVVDEAQFVAFRWS